MDMLELSPEQACARMFQEQAYCGWVGYGFGPNSFVDSQMLEIREHPD